MFIYFMIEVVKQKGLEHITVDDLVAEITPKGRCEFSANTTVKFVYKAYLLTTVDCNSYNKQKHVASTS